MVQKKEIFWINVVRAVCMICVFVLHAESRYGINSFPYSYFFKPFFLTSFFFVSGYLFFKGTEVDYRHKFRSIIGKLIWPYFIFCSLIWIPKMIYRSRDMSFSNYAWDLLGGTASWFIAALVVAQILLMLFVWVSYRCCRSDCWSVYFFIGVILYFWAEYLETKGLPAYPWHYKEAFRALPFMFLGGLFRKYESKLDSLVSIKVSLISGGGYLILMLCALKYGWESSLYSLLISILGVHFLVSLSRYIPNIGWLNYIGKNSIIFYFLSGGVPAIWGLIFKQIFPEPYYVVSLLVTVISVMTVYPIAYFLNRYCPVVTDLYYKRK